MKVQRKVWDDTYKKNHPDKVKESSHKYINSHKDKLKEYHKKYRETHKEYLSKKNKEYREKNAQKIELYMCLYRKAQSPEVLRKHHLKTVYNLTVEEYSKMFELQNGKCAICNRDQSEDKKRFAVDHDHLTGKIRGLLCGKCNKSLGLLGDDVHLLEKALEYLRSS